MKKLLSIILCLSIILSICCYSVSATVDYSYKIDDALAEKLESMDDDDTIDVSIWFNDINHNDVYNQTMNSVSKELGDNKATELSAYLLNFTTNSLNNSQINNYTKYKLENYFTKEVSSTENIKQSDIQILFETKRKKYKSLYLSNNKMITDKLFKLKNNNWQPNILYVSSYAPNVDLTLTKKQIYVIIEYSFIEAVYYCPIYSEDFIQEEPADIGNTYSIEDVDYHTYWQDITGITNMKNLNLNTSNVKIGLLEAAIPYVEKDSAEFGEYYHIFSHMFNEEDASKNKMKFRPNDVENLSNFTSSNYWHVVNSASVIVGDSEYGEGIIPDAYLYCASESNEGAIKGGFEWLIDQGVSVICENNAYLLNYYQKNYYADLSKWIDHIAYHHNVNVVIPGGNGRIVNSEGTVVNKKQDTISVNAMAYNAIVVGNYNYITETSTSAYNSLETLPYKPDVVAPGYLIGTPISSGTSSGTSLSAPITAGIVAYLCTNIYCRGNECLTKAILTASAEFLGAYNTINNSSFTGFDMLTGAGLINVYKAYQILQYHRDLKSFGTYYDCKFGEIYSNVAFSNTETFEITSIQDIGVSLVWLKVNSVTDSHATSSTVDATYPTIRLKIEDPEGNIYSSYFGYDCKANVTFHPNSIGIYKVQYELVNDYVVNERFDFAIALCRDK